MKYCLYISILLISLNCFSQKKYPKNYFRSPVNIPIVLAGTFGELRNNHFHSGIDIKTQGKEGIPIYATADGYVSRIKVAQQGFGKAVYIDHPNGYTTVYAHLQKFAIDIQERVKIRQYQKKRYAIGSIFPKPDAFPVKKGEIIGYSGNTGGSHGAHLHYEIRDTKTEHIINPLLFGLTVEDDKFPTLKSVMGFPLSEDARINNIAQKTIIPTKNIGDSLHIAEKITASGTIGFGVGIFDRLNGANNKNGIYSLEMKVNGKRLYYHDVETFSFAESKYINLLIDYKYYANFRNRIQRTYKAIGNKLRLYENLVNNGKLVVKDSTKYKIEIIAKDLSNNTTRIKIPIEGVKSNMIFKEKDTTAYKITATDFNTFEEKNVTVAFPKNTFYKDYYLDFIVQNDTVKVHDPVIPLNKKFTLTFDTSNYFKSEREKLYIANVYKDKASYVSTKRKENKLYTSTKSLGTYTLKLDTEKPNIKLINFKDGKWISYLPDLKVKIADKQSGIHSFNATIDGKWILMEYDHKTGLLTYDFNDKKLTGSKHIFKLIVSDNVGNIQTVSATFFKKSDF